MKEKNPKNREILKKKEKELFDRLDESLPEVEKKKLREMKEDELIMLHMGFGMGIRNKYCLWKDTELTKKFKDIFIDHPDDMSGVIIENYWRYLKGDDIDPEKVLPNLKKTKKKEYEDWLRRIKDGEKPDGMTDEEAEEALPILEERHKKLSDRDRTAHH